MYPARAVLNAAHSYLSQSQIHLKFALIAIFQIFYEASSVN